MSQQLLPLLESDALFYILSGKFYLAFNDRWTETPEWALRFTRFEAMRKIVDLSASVGKLTMRKVTK